MILKLRRRLAVVSVLLLAIAAITIVKVQSSDAVVVRASAIKAAVALHAQSGNGLSAALDPALAQEQPPVTDKAPEPLIPPPSRQLRVVLDWYPTPYHAPLIVARERDLFDREGLDVSLITPADPSVSPKLVAAQRAELALTSQPQLHFLVEQGLPLVRVGTLVPAPLATLLTRQDGGIERLAQLKGKTIGYVHANLAHMWLDALLRDQPIGPEDITLRHIDFALISALVDGEVDAVIGTMRHVSKQQLAQQGVEATEFMVEESDLATYDELILVANRDVLNQHRRDIAGFLDAVEKATLWLINHPDQGWELLRRAEPGLDTLANARAWPNVLRYLALRPIALQQQRYQRLETYLLRRGLIETAAPVERLATDIGNELPQDNRTAAKNF
ncbi:ABC transporter substrate-binding protein [Halomonas sp. GXIMD04776]|uniref:ABC transporter substrate-binding protein n=1 Tax=Halomonas sp. GXIMD04776 TaxID=3415605 RepID=UPI003CB02799